MGGVLCGRFRAVLLVATSVLGSPMLGSQLAAGQVQGSAPSAFEVVSIRPEPGAVPGQGQVGVTADGWRMRQSPMVAALLTAYVPTTPDAAMYTVSTLVGVPDWMTSQMWDIDAKVPEADLAAWADPARQTPMLRAMVQTMLAERCKLQVHRSTKEVSVYRLVVAKGGPKLKASVPGDPHPGATALPGGGEFLPNDGTGAAAFYDAPISALTVVLANFAGRPIEDTTGLTGRYELRFRRPQRGAPSASPDGAAEAAPTIFEVVEGLGLKLEPARRTVETLAVDHAERPSGN